MAMDPSRPYSPGSMFIQPGLLSKEQCWDRRQTVNLVSAGELVEQSNAAKNNAVDKLAGSAAAWLAAAGWPLLAGRLTMADWPAFAVLAAA